MSTSIFKDTDLTSNKMNAKKHRLLQVGAFFEYGLRTDNGEYLDQI